MVSKWCSSCETTDTGVIGKATLCAHCGMMLQKEQPPIEPDVVVINPDIAESLTVDSDGQEDTGSVLCTDQTCGYSDNQIADMRCARCGADLVSPKVGGQVWFLEFEDQKIEVSGSMIIGREPGSPFAVLLSQYETISRKHAEIIFESENGEDSYSLTDTDSTNGTTLNGTKLGPAEKRILKNSDEIRLGKTLVASLIFRSETR